RTGRAPFVVTLHDHELYELAPQSAGLRAAIVRTLRGVDCAVYVSEALRAHGVDLAGPHRSVVIPIGIETWGDLPAKPPAGFTIRTVPRLIPRKRVDRLIRAFARLHSDRPDARLVIVGEGPERPALARLVRELTVESVTEFTGGLDARRARER